MIVVLFHVFYLLGKLVLRRYNARRGRPTKLRMLGRRREDDDDDSDDLPYVDVGASSKARKDQENLQQRDSSSDDLPEAEDRVPIKFSPPAYVQRYTAVKDALNDTKFRGQIHKVVDFGCAELNFFVYLKKMACVDEIMFVDVDRTILDRCESKIEPLLVDYLHRRDTPLVVHIMEGSVTENDKSLEDYDAVVCIELIEHLYPEPFTMMPYNIFGYIKPKIAIITTPNADFNVLFGGMEGFRHPDHKFEWTREQFKDWAHNIVSRFPEYEVKFQGICYGPPETEHLGACTQMAIFHKIQDLETEKVPGVEGLFKLVKTYLYPYDDDNRTDEQKILDDASYFINKFSINNYDEEEVSLQKILKCMTNFCISVNDLREILISNNWTVIDREDGPVVQVPPDSFSDGSPIDQDALFYYLRETNQWNQEAGPSHEEEWDSEPDVNLPNSQNREEEATSSHANDDVNVDDEVNIINEVNVVDVVQPSCSKSLPMRTTVRKRKEEIKEEDWDDIKPHIITSDSENREEEATCSHTNNDIHIVDLVSTDDEVSIVHEVIVSNKVNVVDKVSVNEEDWDSEPHIIVSDSENREEEVVSPDAEALTANSTASIYPNDICLDDIATESRSIEFANSEVNESSILISSYSETKDSENSATGKESSLAETTSTCVDNKTTDLTASFLHTEEENKSKNSLSHSADLTLNKDNSMCSIFLEPSQLSNQSLGEISLLESTITSPEEKKTNKKLKLNNSTSSNNLNENNFDEPQCASSPYILSSIASKRRKIIEGTEHSNTSSINSSNENLIMSRSESSKNLLKCNNDSSSSSNESVIAESNLSDCSPTTNSESPEKLRHYTGAIPKNLSLKLSVTKISGEETKLDSTSPDIPVSPPNSWSPEIMDSGYPNSNSPPDLSPEYDLSSIVYNNSDSESPSMADIPRGFPEFPAENRDLANNNLDDEGNYMGPEENRQMNLHPLIHVLENDIENENDIFLMRDGFPVWLLRILQRLPLQEENFDE